MGRAGRGGGGGGGRSGGFSGGGGRSGSFGGSRSGSFGGGSSSRSSRSSSGSSFGRSYSSGSGPRPTGGWHGGGYGGGFWGTPRTSGPVIINNSGNRNYTNPSNNNRQYQNGSGNNQNNQNNQNNMGCVHAALVIVMIMSIIVLLFNTMIMISDSGSDRTKLDAKVNVTGYYTDELGWIDDSATLQEGMKYFFEKTGVQPYLYITDNVGGNFYDYAEEFANNKYDELFTDEAHILLIFQEKDGWYDTYCLSGSVADSVIDSEARNILLDKVDEYYYSDYNDNEYFSKAFEDAADEIMKQSSGNMTVIIIPIVTFIAALAAEIVLTKKAKKEKREKELKEMLEKPLETFGSTEASELAKKYENAETTKTSATAEPKQETQTTVINTAETKTEGVCVKCGNTLSSDSIFCSNCGKKVE